MSNSIQTLYDKADSEHCNGNLDIALVYYKKIIDIDPYHYDTLRWIADIYLEKAEWEKAISAFKKAYDICCADADMLNDFALCYYEHGIYETAIKYYKQALEQDPKLDVAHRNFGIALYELYRINPTLAIQNAHWWKTHSPNNPQSQVMTSAILGENLSQQNADYVQGVFDDFAEDFEQKLQDLNYKAPYYIYEAVLKYTPKDIVQHTLDAGCGTGLVGTKIHPLTQTLTGIDLSEEMINLAKKRDIYTALHQGDIITFLQDKSSAYDMIVAGDVLCYFGDLTFVLQKFYTALQSSGILIFTVEYAPDNPFLLTPSGRYTHDQKTTEQILYSVGFKTVHITHKVLRTEHGYDVNGLVVVAICS